MSRRLALRGLGLGSGLISAGLFTRGVSAEAPPRSPPPSPPPSAASLEQRISALEQQQRRRPVVVCGPSGVGKGTLLGRLMSDYPDEFGFSVATDGEIAVVGAPASYNWGEEAAYIFRGHGACGCPADFPYQSTTLLDICYTHASYANAGTGPTQESSGVPSYSYSTCSVADGCAWLKRA